MRCPYCDHDGTRVLDSRPANEGKSIRRRRECDDCNRRFTTFEMVEEIPMLVVKKNGNREEYSREKLLRGVMRACEKRPIAMESLEKLVDEVEKELRSHLQPEITSDKIGEAVMQKLFLMDEVAYVRFASVYRQFKDISVFMKELNELLGRNQLPTKE
jgi:transcriptional repressor NrdR